MPYDWTGLAEGSALTADSLNSRFTSVKEEINDLPELSVQPYSLHSVHIGSPVAIKGKAAVGITTHNYRNHYPGWDNDSANSSFGAAGRPYGTGWNVIFDSSGAELAVNHTALATLSTSPNFAYVVMANITMQDLRHKSTVANGASGNPDYGLFQYGVFKIQITSDGSSWVGIPVSERYAMAETESGREAAPSAYDSATDAYNMVQVWKDIPLRLMLTRDRIRELGLTTEITGVRVVTSVSERHGIADEIKLVLGRSNISVFAIYCATTEV